MNKRKTAEKRYLRASLTVEAAMLMPILFFVVFSCVYLNFHVHNRANLSASAAEQAISGHEQNGTVLFGSVQPEAERSESEDARTVGYAAVSPVYIGSGWSIRTEQTCRLYHPVKMLRAERALKELGDG